MSLKGVAAVRNILILFVMIGCMTALWRSAGTIPAIIAWSAGVFQPSVILLLCFLLNSLMSVLTGTCFGTAATMGVICMSVAGTMGVSPLLSGGAILSGAFFGDRCSPVSTSALLVAELTGTSVFDNIRQMVKTAAVPFLLTSGAYLALGLTAESGGQPVDVQSMFRAAFQLGPVVLAPAAAIIVLSVFRVDVKKIMLVSILCAGAISLAVQGTALPVLLRSLLFGYQAPTQALSALLDGGGILSMVRVSLIVSLSASFSGLFEETGMLLRLKAGVERLGAAATPFAGVLATSAVTSVVACNQTLSILLTHQLCRDMVPDGKDLAIYLENSAVLVAPLVPWSIAGTVPLTTIGAPTGSILLAFFLYLVPLWTLLTTWRKPAGAR